jgi:hypothetical protein
LRQARLRIEPLEARQLLAATTWPGLVNPLLEATPTETLDRANDLGDLSALSQASAIGAIGNGRAGPADVDWYSFSLSRPSQVHLITPDQQVAGALASVLSLYNTDPFDFSDPYDLIGHRLMAQDLSASGHDAQIDRPLAAGRYYVAISGSGNRYFHPFLTDSGFAGSSGPYALLVTATDLGLDPTSNPVLLASDPAPGAQLDRSPLLLRLDYSAPLDSSTINAGQNVRLTYNPHDTFGDRNDRDIPLAAVNFTPVPDDPQLPSANELQIIPAVPLRPGYYQIFLGGDNDTNYPPLADLNGNYLGQDGDHTSGQDFTLTFQVVGVEGNTEPGARGSDTAATAHELGDITRTGLVQAAGAIGEDASAPASFKPANDVEMYHFHLSGSGRFAFAAEVFAGRIGSGLDSGVSLFHLNLATGQLELIAGNDNTQNGFHSDNNAYTPLYTDSALYATLTEGDYYVAVSSHGNVPDPFLGWLPEQGGIFDPNVAHSGRGGASTGIYVLNLLVQPAGAPPKVVAVSVSPNSTLPAPPTQLSVQFSEAVNLEELAFRSFEQSSQGSIKPVYIQAADGTIYYPRLQSFDHATGLATFLLLDALPSGAYELHLSGPLGLSDFGGNPLIGNNPNGDYEVRFLVQGPPRGTGSNPLLYTYQDAQTGNSHEQDLGVLFPMELQAGVTVVRTPASPQAPARRETTDSYHFQVLQDQDYLFLLSGSDLTSDVQVVLLDAAGNVVPTSLQADGVSLLATLHAGSYVLSLVGLPPDPNATLEYQLSIALAGAADQAPPLTSGPAPALRVRLVGSAPSDASTPPRVGGTDPVARTDAGRTSTAVQVSASGVAASSNVGRGETHSDGVAQALAALTTGPVGGVNVPIAFNRASLDLVALRGSDEATLTGITQLLVLTTSSGGATESAAPLAPVPAGAQQVLTGLLRIVGASTPAVAGSMNRCLDALFSAAGWLVDRSLSVLAPPAATTTEDATLEPEAAVTPDAPEGRSEERFNCAPGLWTWVPLVGALRALSDWGYRTTGRRKDGMNPERG